MRGGGSTASAESCFAPASFISGCPRSFGPTGSNGWRRRATTPWTSTSLGTTTSPNGATSCSLTATGTSGVFPAGARRRVVHHRPPGTLHLLRMGRRRPARLALPRVWPTRSRIATPKRRFTAATGPPATDERFLPRFPAGTTRSCRSCGRSKLDAGGAVLAVQIDNELDFYPCTDPKGIPFVSERARHPPRHHGAPPRLLRRGRRLRGDGRSRRRRPHRQHLLPVPGARARRAGAQGEGELLRRGTPRSRSPRRIATTLPCGGFFRLGPGFSVRTCKLRDITPAILPGKTTGANLRPFSKPTTILAA